MAQESIDQFRDAIAAAGLEAPAYIEPGKLHRFPGIGKRNGNTAGWCKLFDDGLGGVFGDWSTDLFETWQAKRDRPLTATERDIFKRNIEGAKARRDAERAQAAKHAQGVAEQAWNDASTDTNGHAYPEQ